MVFVLLLLLLLDSGTAFHKVLEKPNQNLVVFFDFFPLTISPCSIYYLLCLLYVPVSFLLPVKHSLTSVLIAAI